MFLFPGQERDEPVLWFVRRHWIALVPQQIAAGALVLAPVAMRFAFRAVGLTFLDEPLSLGGALFELAEHVVWLIAVLVAFGGFVDYYLDYWIVTDRRLVSIELAGLFSRTIAQVHLSQVQDATSSIRGVLATFMDYGDIAIQTAAEQERFIFRSVPHPNTVVARIMELHQKVAPVEVVIAQPSAATATPAAPSPPAQPKPKAGTPAVPGKLPPQP